MDLLVEVILMLGLIRLSLGKITPTAVIGMESRAIPGPGK